MRKKEGEKEMRGRGGRGGGRGEGERVSSQKKEPKFRNETLFLALTAPKMFRLSIKKLCQKPYQFLHLFLFGPKGKP